MRHIVISTTILCLFLLSFQAAAENSIQGYFAKYQEHIQAGETLEALDIAEAAYELSKDKNGTDNKTTQTLAYNFVQLYISERDMLRDYNADKAIRILKGYIQFLEEQNSDDHLSLIDPLMALGIAQLWYPEKLLEAKKKFRDSTRRFSGDRLTRSTVEFHIDKGLEAFADAINIALIKNTEYPLLSADLRFEAAKELFAKGAELDIAESYLIAAFDGYDQHLQATDARRVLTAFWAGKAKMFSNKLEEANSYLKVVVSAYEESGEFNHPRLLETYNNLIQNYENMEQSQAATPYVVAIGKVRPWYSVREQLPLYQPYPVTQDESDQETIARYRIQIDSRGFVTNIETLVFQGNDGFKPLIQATLKRWRYAPKFKDGNAVESVTEATIRI